MIKISNCKLTNILFKYYQNILKKKHKNEEVEEITAAADINDLHQHWSEDAEQKKKIYWQQTLGGESIQSLSSLARSGEVDLRTFERWANFFCKASLMKDAESAGSFFPGIFLPDFAAGVPPGDLQTRRC